MSSSSADKSKELVLPTKIQHTAVGLRPVAAITDILSMQEEIRTACTQLLVPERDFGLIPGAKKPSLWKSGAERLSRAFNLTPQYRMLSTDVDQDRENAFVDKYGKKQQSFGLFRFVVECSLVSGSGEAVGTAIGVCSSMEKKYIHAPRDQENTILQMAQKRAYVAAVRQALGISDQFEAEGAEDVASEAKEQPAAKAAIDIPRSDAGVALFPFAPKQGVPVDALENGAFVVDEKLLRRAFDWSKKKAAEKEKEGDADGAARMKIMAEALEAELTRRMPATEAKPEAKTPAPVAAAKENFKQSLEESEDDLPF